MWSGKNKSKTLQTAWKLVKDAEDESARRMEEKNTFPKGLNRLEWVCLDGLKFGMEGKATALVDYSDEKHPKVNLVNKDYKIKDGESRKISLSSSIKVDTFTVRSISDRDSPQREELISSIGCMKLDGPFLLFRSKEEGDAGRLYIGPNSKVHRESLDRLGYEEFIEKDPNHSSKVFRSIRGTIYPSEYGDKLRSIEDEGRRIQREANELELRESMRSRVSDTFGPSHNDPILAEVVDDTRGEIKQILPADTAHETDGSSLETDTTVEAAQMAGLQPDAGL